MDQRWVNVRSQRAYVCKWKAQQADSVQIVARAALCFDNQTVTNGCMRWMRRMANRNVTKNGAARFCGSSCAGQMILVFGCMEDILSNFQFYSPGLLMGVQSILQMSCGGRTSSAPSTDTQTDISTNTSASGNMVAERSEVEAEPTEAKAEKSMAKHWSSSVWIIPLAFAVVAALILYTSPRNLYS